MFKFLITPYIINIAYVLGIIFPFFLIYYFYYDIKNFINTSSNKFKTIMAIIFIVFLYEIMLRIFFEFIIVYFNMYHELKTINNKL